MLHFVFREDRFEETQEEPKEEDAQMEEELLSSTERKDSVEEVEEAEEASEESSESEKSNTDRDFVMV